MITILILAFIAFILNGIAVCFAWKWFIVPTFGLSPLSIWASLGIALLFGLIKGPTTSQYKSQGVEKDIKLMTNAIIDYLIVFFIAWLVSFGIPS